MTISNDFISSGFIFSLFFRFFPVQVHFTLVSFLIAIILGSILRFNQQYLFILLWKLIGLLQIHLTSAVYVCWVGEVGRNERGTNWLLSIYVRLYGYMHWETTGFLLKLNKWLSFHYTLGTNTVDIFMFIASLYWWSSTVVFIPLVHLWFISLTKYDLLRVRKKSKPVAA